MINSSKFSTVRLQRYTQCKLTPFGQFGPFLVQELLVSPWTLDTYMLGRMPINSSWNIFVVFGFSSSFTVFNSLCSPRLYGIYDIGFESFGNFFSSRSFFRWLSNTSTGYLILPAVNPSSLWAQAGTMASRRVALARCHTSCPLQPGHKRPKRITCYKSVHVQSARPARGCWLWCALSELPFHYKQYDVVYTCIR